MLLQQVTIADHRHPCRTPLREELLWRDSPAHPGVLVPRELAVATVDLAAIGLRGLAARFS
jgi:hypothetical protein